MLMRGKFILATCSWQDLEHAFRTSPLPKPRFWRMLEDPELGDCRYAIGVTGFCHVVGRRRFAAEIYGDVQRPQRGIAHQ